MPTVRDAVIALLRARGMHTVFGNPGSTELPLFRDFPPDLRYVLGLHEGCVLGMADGFAQATRRASFVNLHAAAGVGHAMGNLFTAFRNRTPMIVTAGQQARSMLPFEPFLHAAQAVELPRPYVKWAVEPARAEDVPHAIERAWHVAMAPPRGPVFVSIPADDWDRACEPVAPREVASAPRPDASALARLGQALEAAARPAFVIGAEVDRDEAWHEAVALAERHRARVFAAPMSGRCGFPEGHRLFAGFLPAIRERIVEHLAAHDLVFAIGSPVFTYHVEGRGPHVPEGARLVQLTQDVHTAAWAPVGEAVVAGVKAALVDLLARPVPDGLAARPLPAAREAAPQPPTPRRGERLSVAFALATLDRVRHAVCGATSVIVEEAPTARPVMQRHLPIHEPAGFYTMCSGGLGWGLPAAVGVAMARPEARVIALVGDGSAMYAIQALWTAAQERLPIVFVVLANRRYAALQEFAPVFGFAPGDPVPGTALPGLDFAALAAAQGVAGVRVEDAGALEAVLAEALEAAWRERSPRLVEIEVA